MAKQIVDIVRGMKAEIDRNKSIRIFGSRSGREYDKTFILGDQAEYDSFNLSYIGKIVGITDKTVTIQERYGRTPRKHRLKLYEFNWRNYDFDLERVTHENAITSFSI